MQLVTDAVGFLEHISYAGIGARCLLVGKLVQVIVPYDHFPFIQLCAMKRMETWNDLAS